MDALLKKYTRLSNTLDNIVKTLPEKEKTAAKAKLEQVRTSAFTEMRNAMRKEATSIIDEENKKQKRNAEKMQQQQKKNQEAKDKFSELFPELKKVADSFLAADYMNKDELFAAYKKLQKKVHEILENLSPEQRSKSNKELTDLSHKINEHKNKLDKEATAEDRVKAQVTKVVLRANRNVKGMTVGQLINALAPTSTKKDVERMLGDIQAQALTLERDNKGTLISVDISDGTLVLASLPENKQLGLIASLLNQLTKYNTDPHGGAIATFVQKIVDDVQKLATGEKTHISTLVKVGDVLHTTHIEIALLINDPVGTIAQLALAMNKVGVSNQDMAIILSSPVEVASMMQLDGTKMSLLTHNETIPELAQRVLSIAGDNNALAELTGHAATSQELTAFAERATPANSKGLIQGEILKVVEAVATIVETRRLLATTAATNSSNPDANNVIEGNRVELVNPIPESIPSTSGNNPSKKPDLNAVEIVEETKSTAPTNAQPLVDVAKFKVDFLNFLATLSKKTNDLASKGDESTDKYEASYKDVAVIARKLANDLTTASNDFFGSKDTKPSLKTLDDIQKFKGICEKAITDAERHFKHHRGFWQQVHPIIKGILGVLAALTIIPGLVVAATEQGYKNTFFAKPETRSAKALAQFKESFSGMGTEMEESAKPKSSGPSQ